MTIPAERLDSRRLPGPNLHWDRPGAILDASIGDADAERVLAAWSAAARRMLDAVAWSSESTTSRRYPGGLSVVLSAPVDALYAATEVNEWAWDAALLPAPPGDAEVAEAAERLAALIEAERRPRLLELESAAAQRGVAFVFDDRRASVGLGAGSLTWEIDEIPRATGVPWGDVRDVPLALVTGTNGKTTTVRMVGAILAAAGLVPGVATTDGVTVGGASIASGDYSGPEGARLAVRDRRVQAAVLETARGGILRRGLTVRRADAALVTNVADDHLGELGVHDLAALADVKLVVGRVVPPGRLVLNADDPVLVARAPAGAAASWFSLDPQSPHLGQTSAFLRDGALVLRSDGREEHLARVAELPSTLHGAARHVVANALGAALVARALGVAADAIAAGLRAFGASSSENPGRMNVFEVRGATVLVDFAHNPHGLKALLDAAAALPARRRLVLIGQAGDRDDASIRALARTAWESSPDRIVVKEMEKLHRGRAPGEVPALIVDELLSAGAPAGRITRAPSELDGVTEALAWSRPGDLLVLTIHVDRKLVIAQLEALGRRTG